MTSGQARPALRLFDSLQGLGGATHEDQSLLYSRRLTALHLIGHQLQAVVEDPDWGADLFALIAGQAGLVDAQPSRKRSLSVPAPGRFQKFRLRCRKLPFDHVAIIALRCNNYTNKLNAIARYHLGLEETWPVLTN